MIYQVPFDHVHDWRRLTCSSVVRHVTACCGILRHVAPKTTRHATRAARRCAVPWCGVDAAKPHGQTKIRRHRFQHTAVVTFAVFSAPARLTSSKRTNTGPIHPSLCSVSVIFGAVTCQYLLTYLLTGIVSVTWQNQN